jgi:cyclopropane-fatty-acyl-phospholipid synthase
VGITLSQSQAELARERIASAGLGHSIDLRVCDCREVADGHTTRS